MGYTKQLALVQYPAGSDVRQGYVTNATSLIQYDNPYNWANGSTNEIVYNASTGSNQLGLLYPYERATVLYKLGNRTHVVYNTDKGPHTKSGYVDYEGSPINNNITIPSISDPDVVMETYGTSGKGRPLNAYKIGSGNKVLFAGFAIHGFEDAWNNDGLELVKIGNKLIEDLAQYKRDNGNLHGWTVYVVPCMNPDGVIDG